MRNFLFFLLTSISNKQTAPSFSRWILKSTTFFLFLFLFTYVFDVASRPSRSGTMPTSSTATTPPPQPQPRSSVESVLAEPGVFKTPPIRKNTASNLRNVLRRWRSTRFGIARSNFPTSATKQVLWANLWYVSFFFSFHNPHFLFFSVFLFIIVIFFPFLFFLFIIFIFFYWFFVCWLLSAAPFHCAPQRTFP